MPRSANKRKKRKGRGKRKKNYNIYVYKVLKEVSPKTGISRKAMSIMNSYVQDVYTRLTFEAEQLVKYRGRKTLMARDVSSTLPPSPKKEHAPFFISLSLIA